MMSAAVAVMGAPVLGIPAIKTPAMRVLAWEEKSRREGVSREEVQEEVVPCGAVLLSAALLVAPLAISQVATNAVEAMKAIAVVKRVIWLAVYEVEMMGKWAETDLCRLPFLSGVRAHSGMFAFFSPVAAMMETRHGRRSEVT
jgi:hypothetical protein